MRGFPAGYRALVYALGRLKRCKTRMESPNFGRHLDLVRFEHRQCPEAQLPPHQPGAGPDVGAASRRPPGRPGRLRRRPPRDGAYRGSAETDPPSTCRETPVM